MKSIKLLGDKKFYPFFWTQFFGAFNDNFFKNALVILITFRAADKLGLPASMLVTASAGIFILPFFLFSATAGQIADSMEKAKLIRWVKFFEILIMALAVIGFLAEQVYFLLFVLFLMGFQSAIFGPVKYSIVPRILPEKELMAGNAMIGAGTFLAILLGTILGGFSIAQPEYGIWLVSSGVMLFAVLGWLAALKVQNIPSQAKNLKINYNIFSETLDVIRFIKSKRNVYLAAIGISWFWFVGASYLSLFPSYGKEYLFGDEYVVNLFLACFSVGIGVGSMICEKLSKGEVSGRLVPVGLAGMSVFAVILYLLSPKDPAYAMHLVSIPQFLSETKNILILLSMILFAISGGIYIVPLYALIQKWCEASHLSRVIAGNNILNALFMVISSLLVMALLKFQITIPQIFLILGILNLSMYLVLKKNSLHKPE
jgi:acyl-[acyl-carrier-protein]-phospholipid O-acyltransferase/long-chain-fatty-acid--[acyl-carrier-protein] ligase